MTLSKEDNLVLAQTEMYVALTRLLNTLTILGNKVAEEYGKGAAVRPPVPATPFSQRRPFGG